MNQAMRRSMLLSTDKKISKFKSLLSIPRPRTGWMRTIREALGMTAAQLAKRMQVKTPRIFEIEHSEADGRVTIATMQRIARAMGCEFVWAIVPKEASSLEQMRHDRARAIAEKQLARVDHSMALENQLPKDRSFKARRAELTLKLLENDRRLWADDVA